jgi:hypothetical protein
MRHLGPNGFTIEVVLHLYEGSGAGFSLLYG